MRRLRMTPSRRSMWRTSRGLLSLLAGLVVAATVVPAGGADSRAGAGKVPRLVFPLVAKTVLWDNYGDPRGNGRHAGIDMGTFVYAEVVLPARDPQFILIEEDVPVGASRRVAILEMSRRPDRWRVWLNGKPVTKPFYLPGSSARWAPIATAESWNGGEAACNSFAFRFERVSVSHGRGGSWFAFQPGEDFRDAGYRLRQLAAAPAASRARTLTFGAVDRPAPYAFLAASS